MSVHDATAEAARRGGASRQLQGGSVGRDGLSAVFLAIAWGTVAPSLASLALAPIFVLGCAVRTATGAWWGLARMCVVFELDQSSHLVQTHTLTHTH